MHELLAFMQKGELVTARFELNDVVQEALNITKGDGYGGFNPLLDLETGLPEVIGNEIQVRKILVNLLRNAVEAMRAGGVPISTISISVRTNEELNMASYHIESNGNAKIIFFRGNFCKLVDQKTFLYYHHTPIFPSVSQV